MKLTSEQVAAAKNRRLKEPLDITGYDIIPMKVSLVGEDGPRTRQVFAIRKIETIGDLAALSPAAFVQWTAGVIGCQGLRGLAKQRADRLVEHARLAGPLSARPG